MVMDDEFQPIQAKEPPGGGKKFPFLGCGIALACVVLLVLMLLPATRSAREAARRSQCVCGLKQLAVALHNYESAEGCFPPAAITDDEGRPLLSWRVLILPYLEQEELYKQFRLDEPWDSPHNRSLLAETPSTYLCPSDLDRQPGDTTYLALVGESAAFSPDFRPRPLDDYPDGLDKTIFVAEARRRVPWTKPDDVTIAPGDLHSLLGSSHPGGFNACFGDGSIRFIKSTSEAKVLRAISTRNGHEELSADQF